MIFLRDGASALGLKCVLSDAPCWGGEALKPAPQWGSRPTPLRFAAVRPFVCLAYDMAVTFLNENKTLSSFKGLNTFPPSLPRPTQISEGSGITADCVLCGEASGKPCCVSWLELGETH